MGYIDAQEGDQARTAFRKAEKKYKLYKHASTSRSHSSKLRLQVPPTNLTDVIDFSKIDNVSSVAGIRKLQDQFEWPVYALENYPGFYFIPGALTVEQQLYWIKEALTSFIEPPNRTNHNAVYGPISDLWSAAHKELVLVEERPFETSDSSKFQGNGLLTGQENFDENRAGSAPRGAAFDNSYSVKACLHQKVNSNITGHDSSDTTRLTTEVHTANSYIDAVYHSSQDTYKTDKDLKKAAFKDSHLSHCTPQPRLSSSSVDERRPVVRWKFADPRVSVQNEAEFASSSKMVPAELLLRKLRWATLGLQFDWSKRAYNTTIPHRTFPVELAQFAARLGLPAMVDGDFHAEAAIVNFFGPDDMLGGHIDDMEADWNKPIVSMSLGCKSIFLLGGVAREEPPIAMFLRSGDVVLMAGEARSRFHGVPRIFTGADEADLPDFSAVSSNSANFPFIDYIKQSRINVNIRQVY
ncbi:hypothetical protein O6H91_09G098100 [Diphasiastrum complanatum]|uniref:Uncharacterized protein n=2 Tax=Diphasiastrum complanatum TaxID=34168 RepID=A0ACC2CSG9_DIPCM|nr:hypothetical protein O6H91_09G098100 [Diphasiastrum complanatum]KAJ7544898.1 hypothetical protein O6H91_09G098100 [Diphasiastrum complanatum]